LGAVRIRQRSCMSRRWLRNFVGVRIQLVEHSIAPRNKNGATRQRHSCTCSRG
jgi:hypothetical protein